MSRRVLVTGAASGLGLALVELFSRSGDRVLATDLGSSCVVLPAGVDYLQLDVRDEEHWRAARDQVGSRWGGLDVLVNNAGVASGGRIDRSTMEEWQLVTDINLFGVVRGCRTFAPVFKQQRAGHIVNVASIAGLAHPPGMASYNAVKAAVVALSETLTHELAPYGVCTSVVCPSFFKTNLAASLRGSDRDVESKAAQLIEGSSLTADDIAAEVVAGIERQDRIILPDEVARATYQRKLNDPDTYDQLMATTARRAFEREQEAQPPANLPSPAAGLS